MNLQDALLVLLAESTGYPSVGALAQSAYDQLLAGDGVGYQVLDDLIAEASGKGALRALRREYSPTAFEAILSPILGEIGREKPIRTSRPEWHPTLGEDPLAAPC